MTEDDGRSNENLRQVDERKNRSKRRVIWVVGFLGLILATALVTSRIAKNVPQTADEHLVSLFPRYLVGFETIQKADVELVTPTSTSLGPIQYGIAYYPARERFSDDLLGIELRVDRYPSSSIARKRDAGPFISETWGFEGFETDWLVGGDSRELPSSGSNVAVDICTWEGLYGPFQGAIVYSWTRQEFRFQLTLVGDPVYLLTEEGESHIIFAWGDVDRRF